MTLPRTEGEPRTIPEILRVTQHTKSKHVSLEIIPPFRGEGLHNVLGTLDSLNEFAPSFISVTSHPDELSSSSVRTPGIIERKGSKRPGTIGICAALRRRYPKVATLAHVICYGLGENELEDTLIELDYLGVRDLLALRGDTPELLKSKLAAVKVTEHREKVYRYGIDLVQKIAHLNQGKYLVHDTALTKKQNHQAGVIPTQFSIGVAGYPEKHSDARSLEEDIVHLKAKVDAGAQYIITQMFFDTHDYLEFTKHCVAAGITVPIIPGLKPLSSFRHLQILPQRFATRIPDALAQAVHQAQHSGKNPEILRETIREIGTQWCIHQCQELYAAGVPLIHFYTMNKGRQINKIFKALL